MSVTDIVPGLGTSDDSDETSDDSVDSLGHVYFLYCVILISVIISSFGS
jgi:hypothetical protein